MKSTIRKKQKHNPIAAIPLAQGSGFFSYLIRHSPIMQAMCCDLVATNSELVNLTINLPNPKIDNLCTLYNNFFVVLCGRHWLK